MPVPFSSPAFPERESVKKPGKRLSRDFRRQSVIKQTAIELQFVVTLSTATLSPGMSDFPVPAEPGLIF